MDKKQNPLANQIVNLKMKMKYTKEIKYYHRQSYSVTMQNRTNFILTKQIHFIGLSMVVEKLVKLSQMQFNLFL